jgi:cytochrome b561
LHHKFLGYATIALIFVHAGAALRRHFHFKDDTLRKHRRGTVYSRFIARGSSHPV